MSREEAQWLRALAVPPKNPGSTLSTTWQLTHIWGYDAFFWHPRVPDANLHVSMTPMHIKINKNLKKTELLWGPEIKEYLQDRKPQFSLPQTFSQGSLLKVVVDSSRAGLWPKGTGNMRLA